MAGDCVDVLDLIRLQLGPEILLPNESGPARIFNTLVFVVYHNYNLGPTEVMFHSIIYIIGLIDYAWQACRQGVYLHPTFG